MKVVCINSYINFKRALLPEELAEYTSTLKEAKKVTGQTGKSVFIMPSTCLPQVNNLNTGVGNLSSDLAQEYIEYR